MVGCSAYPWVQAIAWEKAHERVTHKISQHTLLFIGPLSYASPCRRRCADAVPSGSMISLRSNDDFSRHFGAGKGTRKKALVASWKLRFFTSSLPFPGPGSVALCYTTHIPYVWRGETGRGTLTRHDVLKLAYFFPVLSKFAGAVSLRPPKILRFFLLFHLFVRSCLKPTPDPNPVSLKVWLPNGSPKTPMWLARLHSMLRRTTSRN
jgi:hypothetical protein